MSRQLVIAPQVLLPGEKGLRSASLEVDLATGYIIAVHDGLSQEVEGYYEIVHVAANKVLLPGLIDTHVHLNQPGRTPWEGFQTGTLAALSGGVTTLIDMPLNSIPPTTTVEGLETKQAEAKRVGVNCDIGFWGGIVPGNQAELVPLLDRGVKGFKCFLIESGVDEFPCVQENDLREACEALKDTHALILFHAELDSKSHNRPESSGTGDQNPALYSTFLDSRPEQWELSALDLILKYARQYPKLRFHIVHLSAASALPTIRKAREDGVRNLTVETCFHYLCLKAEEIPDNATQFKCCPPIRDESNRQLLLAALLDGTIDYVVSDHSPCVPELKKGDFLSAWGGVSGLGLGLSLLYTELGQQAGLAKVIEWMSTAQAKQVGMSGLKGAIQGGSKADFVVFDPEQSFEVTHETLHFKNKVSPYIGKRLRGLVEQTYLGGRLVWQHSKGREGAVLSTGVLL
ncbi:allantoinase [Kwoniella sp. DSM 27419]